MRDPGDVEEEVPAPEGGWTFACSFRSAKALLPPHKCGGSHLKCGDSDLKAAAGGSGLSRCGRAFNTEIPPRRAGTENGMRARHGGQARRRGGDG
jgi:hypothetical protein